MMKASSGSSTKRTGVLSSAEYLPGSKTVICTLMISRFAHHDITRHNKIRTLTGGYLRVMVHEGHVLATEGARWKPPQIVRTESLLRNLRSLS